MIKKFILCILIFCLPLISYALNSGETKTRTFIVKITSGSPQPFFGTYLTDHGLTYVAKQTPFEIKINGKELRLMLGVTSSNPIINVELLKQDKNGKKLISKASGRSIYMCESTITHNDKNNCYDVSVLAN